MLNFIKKMSNPVKVVLILCTISVSSACYLADWGKFLSLKNVSPTRIHDLRGISIVSSKAELLWPSANFSGNSYEQKLVVTLADPRGGKAVVEIRMCPVFGDVTENPLVILGAQSEFYKQLSDCSNRDYSKYSKDAQKYFAAQKFLLDIKADKVNPLGLTKVEATFQWNKRVLEVIYDQSSKAGKTVHSFADVSIYVFATISKPDSDEPEVEVMLLPLKVLPNVYNTDMQDETRREILSDNLRMCSREDYNTCELRSFRFQEVPATCGDGIVDEDAGEECDPPKEILNDDGDLEYKCTYDCKLLNILLCPPELTCIEPNRQNLNPVIVGYDYDFITAPENFHSFSNDEVPQTGAFEEGENLTATESARAGDEAQVLKSGVIKIKAGQIIAIRGVYSKDSIKLYQSVPEYDEFDQDFELPDAGLDTGASMDKLGMLSDAKALVVQEESIDSNMFIGSNKGTIYNIEGDDLDMQRSALEPSPMPISGSFIYASSKDMQSGDKEIIVFRIYDGHGGMAIDQLTLEYQ